MPLTSQDVQLAIASPAGVTLNVANADLASGAAAANLGEGGVVNSLLAANAVKFGNLNVFVAHGQTGTGSSQSIAHGLGATPSVVLVIFEGSTASQAVTYGVSTSTNVVVTVTSAATFTVLALV
jgi:hypothetical protein